MIAPTSTAVPPSGEQHEIGHGRQRVVVTEVGATLRGYTVDGAAVVDGFGERDMCSAGRGQVLAPWPNRLGDGRYSADGRHGHAAELARALGNGLEDGYPLGAHGEAVGRVLHVAAGVDAARRIFNGGANLEFRVRREGVLAGTERGIEKWIVHRLYTSPWSIRGKTMRRNFTSVSPTAAPVSRTSSWLSFRSPSPAAMLVTQETASTFIPM